MHTTAPGWDVVLYDGHCRLCSLTAHKVARFERGGQIELRSFRDDQALAAFPGLTRERCEKALQLVAADGGVFEGLEVFVHLAARRWWGKLALLYYVPGLRQLLDACYRLVARYRFRISAAACEGGTCPSPFGRGKG